MVPRLVSVQTGSVAPLGPERVASGIRKAARQGVIAVSAAGLDGDEQADLESHGGTYKAVYAYASAHFPDWAARFPAITFTGGTMGENLTIAGLTETDICVGDVHAIGSVLLEVCQPRQPCFKLNLLHDDEHLSNAMLRTFQSGWYYRVVRPGTLAAGDAVTLAARPNPDFPFARLVEIVYRKRGQRPDLLRMTDMEGLAPQWRERARGWLTNS